MDARRERWIVWGAVAMLAASLFLPVGYGAEIYGVIYGWMFVSVLFPLCPLYVLPVAAVLMPRRMKEVAVLLVALGVAGWTYLVFQGGFVIDAFLREEKVFASGLVCGLVSTGALAYVLVRRAIADRRKPE